MRRSEKEFLVVMLATSPEERFFVDGRSHGAGVSVGDLFQLVYEIPSRRIDDRDAAPANPRAVSLRVEEIHANRRSVGAVEPGGTARLYLSGSGQERLRKGDVLGGGPELE